MGSTQVFASNTSQVIANLTVITAGASASVTNVTVVPRLGSAQPVRVRALVNGVDVELELILYDKAFEEYGIYGNRVKKGKQGENY